MKSHLPEPGVGARQPGFFCLLRRSRRRRWDRSGFLWTYGPSLQLYVWI